MYETTLVTGEIRQADPSDFAMGRFWGNVITPWTVENVVGIVRNEQIEACHEFAVLVRADESGNLPENWDNIAGIDTDALLMENFAAFDPHLLGVNDLALFVEANSDVAVDGLPNLTWEPNDELSWVANWEDYVYVDLGGLQINFAKGFYPEAFVLTEGRPIPIVISNRIMGLRGYELWDLIYISTTTIRDSRIWHHTPAVIVGTHNRSIRSNGIIGGAVLPLAALESIVGDELRYMSISFEIDPMYNREMLRIQEELQDILDSRNAGEVPLRLILRDEHLRMVVAPMEQHLSLLRLLYPVAIALSVVIGIGVSVLLMLQNAKIASIMRVLGTTKTKSRSTLCAEQVATCLLGLALGLVILVPLGWGFGFASSLLLAGVYLASAAIGTASGAVVVTNRAPLELLQVRE
jgi:hypothetical protein